MLKEPKVRSKKHLRFISGLACCTCEIEGLTQAAHIRSGNQAGMSLKSGDNCVLPLCVPCHLTQGKGEKKFWTPYGGIARATTLAKALFKATGDEAEANYLIKAWRNENRY